MASCLTGKNTAEKLFTGRQEKQNIREMVNKVVWELGTRAIQTKDTNSWIRKESEWNKALSNGLGYTCDNLNDIVKGCLTDNADAEVGPPVNPEDGKFSSSAEDLHGDDYEFQGIDKSKC